MAVKSVYTSGGAWPTSLAITAWALSGLSAGNVTAALRPQTK